MLKKISTAFCLLISASQIVSAQQFTVDNVNYELYANGYWRAKVTGAEPGVTSLTVPDSVVYENTSYPVTLVAERAFYNNTELTEIHLGNKLESVGDYSFAGCTNLSSIDFGESVATLWQYSFKDCKALTEVNIPGCVNSFKYGAFDGCTNLQRVNFGGTLDQWASITIQNYNLQANPLYLAHNLYINNELVTSLKGMTVTEIAACAFAGATCLTGVLDLPGTLQKIGSQAFSGCTNLSGVNFDGPVDDWMQRELGGSVLSYSDGDLYIQGNLLTTLRISESVTKIANYAFQGVKSIKGEVVIPETVKSIGYYAFSGCTGITSVEIGDGVTSIGSSCFENCTALESVSIGQSATSVPLYGFRGCTALTTLSLGQALKSIETGAFDGCSAIQSELQIPSQLTKISDYAFRNCSAMTGQLNVPQSLISIGSSAFENCSSLTAINLGNTIQTLSNQAFKNCSGFKGRLVVPASVTSLGDYCFQGCSGLESFEILASVTTIPQWLFAECSGLTGTLTIPDGVTSIMTNAFSKCSGLEALVLPESLKTIGNYAFENCSGLRGTVVIPDNVTTINQYAFSRCTGIERVEFGQAVKYLYQGAFYNCESLDSIALPAQITSVPQSCFWQCYGLKNVVIGDAVTTIGQRAFADCRAMTGELVIPASVKTIGANAFESCGISKLTIGDGLQSAGDYAFACSRIDTIVCAAEVPPTATSATFYVVNKQSPVYVPAASVEEYKAAEGWKEFKYFNPVALENLEIAAEITTIKSHKTVELSVVYTPFDATYTEVLWESQNPGIAEVDESGVVTGIKSGTAVITVTSKTNPTLTASVEITVEPYIVTYYVGEDVEGTQQYDYNDTIEPLEGPEKEGHTFTGWDGLPETMPDEDLEVYAQYDVNTYHLLIYIDDELYDDIELEYGSRVELPEIETDEDREFDQWLTEIPETMPAHDVEVRGQTRQTDGLQSILADGPDTVDVYNLQGVKVAGDTPADKLHHILPQGLYIVKSGSGARKIVIGK